MTAFIFLFLVLAFNAFGVETLGFKAVERAYNDGYAPLLENHVEQALAGRCVHKFKDKRTLASALLISFGQKGFEAAPITMRNKPVSYFDHKNWFDIFELYPEIASQFLVVINGDNHGLLLKRDLWGEDKGMIRETENLFIIKAFKNEKFYRYCYYKK